MKYYKCKCGKREFWGSGMYPEPCQVCEDCGTTMGGQEPEEHKWITRYNPNTGEPYEICSRCLERKDAKRNKDGIEVRG